MKSFHPSVECIILRFSYNLVFTALDVDGISCNLMQHRFPHEQWAMLAVSLKLAVNISEFQDNDDFYQLKNVIDFWVCSDSQRSWEKLVKAIIFCKQKRVAKSLADAMNVSFSGEFSDVHQFFYFDDVVLLSTQVTIVILLHHFIMLKVALVKISKCVHTS